MLFGSSVVMHVFVLISIVHCHKIVHGHYTVVGSAVVMGDSAKRKLFDLMIITI